MGQCHKCNFPLKDGAIACPQCGDVIVPIEDGHGTVDQVTGEIAKTIEFAGPSDTDESHDTNVEEGTSSEVVSAGDKTVEFSKEMTLDVTQQTLDFSASDYRNTLKQDFTSSDSVSDDVPAGTGTVDAMGPDGASALTNYGLDEDEIVMELDEDTSIDASHATLDATGQSANGDGQSTHVATSPVEPIGDDQVTYVVSPNSPYAAEHSDNVGTVQLPSTPSENAGERTAVFGSSESGPGTLEAGSSGTEGRLKRLWDGVAGSSGNPMHSLQATGLQASDSIFERVATRRVADGSVRGGDWKRIIRSSISWAKARWGSCFQLGKQRSTESLRSRWPSRVFSRMKRHVVDSCTKPRLQPTWITRTSYLSTNWVRTRAACCSIR